MKNLQLTTALAIALIGNISYPLQLQALPTNHHFASIKFVPPPPPPDQNAPGSRSGAASRGCYIANQTVTALVPTYQQTINQDQEIVPVTQVWGLTTAEHPAFFFFVPYNASSIANIEFVLQEKANNKSQTLYRTYLTSPASPGIIRVNLPPAKASLEVGKMYHWFFKVWVQCDPKEPAKLDYADGWVQRMNENSKLTEQIKQATLQQKPQLYAANGIWYDAIKSLAELRLNNPNNETLKTQWTTLLNVVGLEEIANQQLINCCQPNRGRYSEDVTKHRKGEKARKSD